MKDKRKTELRLKQKDEPGNITMKERYEIYDIEKIGYLDIEATNLDADFGFILSWAMVVRDIKKNKVERVTYAAIDKKTVDAHVANGSIAFDEDVLTALSDEWKDLDLLVGHYFHGWRKMDMPYIRTRFADCKMKFPLKYREMRYADTWKMAHLLHKVSRYTLDNVSNIFDVKTKKTRVNGKEWQLAKYGHKPSMKYVVDHNIKDVKITHKVHRELEEYMPISNAYV